MFLRSLVELNNSISVRNFGILPPNSDEDQTKEKGLRRIPVLSQSGISDFLLPSGYYLPKNEGPDVFRPLQSQTQGGAASSPPRNRHQCILMLQIV